jgi:hypothetical protein
VLGCDRESKSSHFLAGHAWSSPLLTCCVIHFAIPMNGSRTTEKLVACFYIRFFNSQSLKPSTFDFEIHFFIKTFHDPHWLE